jgi:hypothetical protein
MKELFPRNKELEAQEANYDLLGEVLEQLKIMNNTLEEIHDELHEFTNRSGY